MRDVVKRTKLTENCSKKTIKKYVDEVIQELTLDEKIGVMSGQVTEKKLLDDLFLIEHYNVKPYPTKAVERLGIPNIRFVDGPRGVVAGSATCFPVSMARGASFDRDLEEKIGEVIGAEVRAVGGNYYGGVCINLPRNPRWGRAQECYGEDTYHLGEMGAALTRGVQSQNVMACIKHFAMNSIENARFKADVHADKRTLFEVYLPHFKRCIEEGAASVMGAYNKVYGEQASESKYLLKDILRDKWGFEGFTLSDFLWAVKDGPKAVKSGMNVEMPCICHYAEQIPKAIEDGTLAMEDVKGAEVVQLYIGCEGSAVDRPVKILKDFARVELMPGEEKKVSLQVSSKDMAYYSEEKDDFVEEDITYIAYTGDCSCKEALKSVKFEFGK